MSAVVFELAKEAEQPVVRVCRALEVSRSTAYARRGRPPSRRARETMRLDVEVRAVFEESRGRYGSPRVHAELREQGRQASRKRVARRMKAQGLRARRPKRFRRTTQADGSPVAPNLLARQFSGHGKNEVWVGDVTYVWTWEGWLYLAILVDLGTRGIVGWATSERCDTKLCLRALERAVARHHPPVGLMHHSDRGSTYTAEDYQDRMDQLGMVVSMSRKGDCWDNAVAESTIGSIKAELLADWTPPSRTTAMQALFHYIEGFYNPRRRHSSLGYCSPLAVELSLLNSHRAA
jgi:transposase InsO family protein